MSKIINNFKSINHRKIWLNSMIGMTWGFLATLVVGTIIGLFGINQQSSFSHFVNNIKGSLTYITPFGIGVGIGIKANLKPVQILAIGIGAFIVGQSLFVPKYNPGGIDWIPKQFGIFVPKTLTNKTLFLPGDVFGAWIAGVSWIYFFKVFKWNTFIDVIIVPIVGAVIGFVESFFVAYATSTAFVLLEWLIQQTINKNHIEAIFLAPILGLLMGFALSFPTSSAAAALQLHLTGDAATAAIAATAAQMLSFGVMTYFSTKSWSKTIAVAFGSSMIHMDNFMKKPKILIVPGFVSAISALLAVAIVPLEFPISPTIGKVTSGMGTAGLYGQIFTLQENGWTNLSSWMNVIFMQILVPIVITIPISFLVFKKYKFIKPKEMDIKYA